MPAPSDIPSEAPPAARLGALPVLRAALATALLALWVLSALPHRPLDAARLDRPGYAHAVHALVEGLRSVGVDASREAVEQALVALSEPVVAVRNALVDPLAPALDFAQMGQRWGLFLQTGRTAYRIEIVGRASDGMERVLYRPHEVDALGLGGTLAFRRLRGLYNPAAKGAPRAQFEGFVDWAARAVFAARPALREVRVRVVRLRLATPDEPTSVVELAHESVRVRPLRGPAPG